MNSKSIIKIMSDESHKLLQVVEKKTRIYSHSGFTWKIMNLKLSTGKTNTRYAVTHPWLNDNTQVLCIEH